MIEVQYIISGGGGVGFLFLFRHIMNKLNNKQDKAMCDVVHETIEKELLKNNERFEKIDGKLDFQQVTLTNLDKNVALIAQRVNDKKDHLITT